MHEVENSRRNNVVVLEQSFNKLLNVHGYGFQYSMLEVIKGLHRESRSQWEFEVSEFPARIPAQDTRIDFILKNRSGWYMVAECKRVDPKFSNWCFIRAPSVKRNHHRELLWVDRVEGARLLGPGVQGVGMKLKLDHLAYHIGLTLKSQRTSNETPRSRNAIEEAAGQVCRGANGLIELLLDTSVDLVPEAVTILPVIFTTARLWVSKCDLASASVQDGAVKTTEGDLEEKSWIYYQYHISPALKHSRPLIQRPSELSEALGAYYVRTIPIVTPAGVEDFLATLDPTSF